MARKLFLKRFGRTKGIDLGRNHLTRDPLSALTLQNVEVSPSDDLETSRGHKVEAQYYSSPRTFLDEISPLYGMDLYQYTDKATGELLSEVVGIGDSVYKLKKGTIRIAYSGVGAATFSVLPSLTTSPNNVWLADLKVAGISQSGFPANLGIGDDVSSSYLLKNLRNAINSVANFECQLTPSAIVNGNQTNRGAAAAVTVFNAYSSTAQPHSFTVSTTEATRGQLLDRQPLPDRRVTVDVIAQTGTTLTCKLPNPTSTFDVNNLDEIGVGLYSASILPITEETSVVPSLTLTFSYWERIYGPNENFAAFTPNTWELYPKFHNYVMKNHSNNLYIGMPFAIGTDVTSYQNGATTTPFRIPPRSTGLMKYDGRRIVGAGLPRLGEVQVASALGAGIPAGNYKYLARAKYLDAQGNITYGTATDDFPEMSLSVTTTGVLGLVEIYILPPGTDPNLGVVTPYLSKNYAVANGGPQVGTTITVAAATHTLRVGDYAILLDRTGGTDVLVTRTVTAITNTTITISGANVTVNDLDYISGGMTVEIFRTKIGGNNYYLQSEQPVPVGTTTTLTIVDSSLDTALGVQYDGPFTGSRRKDLPPVVGIIENHQGLLVGTGDPQAPETLYWPNFDSVENWPLGTGQVDVGGDEGGALSCIISDGIDSLAVFKEDSYHNVSGDLDAGAFSITAYSEGGVGCLSPHGACHFREQIFFLSKKGPRILKDGAITDYDTRLLPYFFRNEYAQMSGQVISSSNSRKLVLKRSVLFNDKDSEKILMFIPAESGTPGSGKTLRPNNFSKTFIYDYRNDLWTEKASVSDLGFDNFAGGICSYQGDIYFTGRHMPGSDVGGLLQKFSNTFTEYDYTHNSKNIVSVFEPQWLWLDEPSLSKEFLRLKVYRFDSEVETSVTTNFTLSIKTFRNFSKAIPDTVASLLFTDGVDREKTLKLKSNKARALLFQLRGGAAGTGTVPTLEVLRISGYEIVAVAVDRQEDIVPL